MTRLTQKEDFKGFKDHFKGFNLSLGIWNLNPKIQTLKIGNVYLSPKKIRSPDLSILAYFKNQANQN